MRVFPLAACAALVVLAVVPAQALESFVLYDDFNAPLINPSKWFGSEDPVRGTEAVRHIVCRGREPIVLEVNCATAIGKLLMGYRAYGDTSSNNDVAFNALRLSFLNPGPVTAIRTTVTVVHLELTDCPANIDATRARAMVGGTFFNTGTPTPGDFTNDVFGRVRLQRRVDSTDPPGVLRAQGQVFRCLDPFCNFSDDLPIVFLGFVNLGQPAMLGLQWDPANSRFIFELNGATTGQTYPWLDAAPPAIQFKGLTLSLVVENCILAPRPMAAMDALFDDVFVNASGAVTSAVPLTAQAVPSGNW